MTICPMDQSHVAAVAEIGRLCFSEPWSEAAMRGELQNPHGEIYVCCEEGAVLGYASIAFVLDEGSINNIAVLPQFRRRGIADALLYFLDGQADRRSLSFFTLEVRASNQAALALYEKHGYRPVGRRRGFYTKPAEDAVLMTKYYQMRKETEE